MDASHLETALLAALVSFLHVRFWRLLVVPFKALAGKLEEEVTEELAEGSVRGLFKKIRKWMSRSKKKRQPERNTMSKKTVKFVCVDAPTPKKSDGMVNLHAPLDLNYQDGLEYALDLGFTCNRPLIVFSSRKMDVVSGGMIPANYPAKIRVIAKLNGTISRGEQILTAVPAGLADFEIEK